jgi:hypothetical protein
MSPPPRHLIVDAHEDIAFNMICAGRDYRQSAFETRAPVRVNEWTLWWR